VNISAVLNKDLVDIRRRPQDDVGASPCPGLWNGEAAWLVSRIASRQAQERILRHWNRRGALPSGVEALPRFSPGITPARRLEAL
jgi:hypothetical protein